MISILTEYSLLVISFICAFILFNIIDKKIEKYENNKKTSVQQEIVFLVAFVHEKDNKHIIVENYFHKEVIDKKNDLSKDVDTYGTLTHKILPILNKQFLNVKVLNIQKLQGGLIIK